MKRPYSPPGLGWLVAVIVLVVALGDAFHIIAVDPIWLIVGLAVAILV